MQREEALFDEALGLPAAERPAFLVRTCGGDHALRHRVEALLQEHETGGGALDLPPPAIVAEIAHELKDRAPPNDFVGTKVGHYKLLEKIGEGGCGVVLLAEQEEPVRRRVAVKVIKLGMDTREVVARFEAERQALALMDHPNISRVLDAGATDSGRPYFVMELVRGIPITRYCDEHRLNLNARLTLFIQVCHAVQHAHQKGIVHRDLKPSNILVTVHDGIAVPKVIDFGIAKATQGRLTDSTLFTALEQFMGTPAYMSPEQAEMNSNDVDTRSDIYSLCVLLYELLTGCTPFDSKEIAKLGLDAVRRTIREQVPAKPSARVGTLAPARALTIAEKRGTDPGRLRGTLRGDLDWVVLRCLEKERSRRYETANGLAMDIDRYLHNEAVVARPPNAIYLLRKLILRNKAAFIGSCAFLAALLAGLAFSIASLRREQKARMQADTAAARSSEVARFMRDMLAGVGPQVALGRDTRMLREILDETVERLPRELRDQPAVEADLRETLGNVYRDLGEYHNATLMHETVLQMRRQIYGPNNSAVAKAMANLGETYARAHRLAEAETMLRDSLAMRQELFGRNDAVVLATQAQLANVLREDGKPTGSLPEHSGAGEPPQLPIDRPVRQPLPSTATVDAAVSPSGAEDRLLAIRVVVNDVRPVGQSFHGGNFLMTAKAKHVLDDEFSAEGIRVEWSMVASGPDLNKLAARGTVDVAYEGDIGAISGRAEGLSNRLLLALNGGIAGVRYLVVPANSPIHSVADLKGRRLATVKQTGGHLTLLRFLEKYGISENEVELVDQRSAAGVVSAVVAGECDATLMPQPFDLVAQGKLRVVLDIGNDPDLAGSGMFWVSVEFEKRYPRIVQRLVTALIKTAAWNSDERNRHTVFELWSKPDNTIESVEASWAGLPLKEGLSPLMDDYFMARVRRRANEARRFGLISTAVRIDDWAEPKYLQEALKELHLEGYWSERDASGKPQTGK